MVVRSLTAYSAKSTFQEVSMSDQVISPQQETAMLALLSGQTQRRAAEIAGVREETVSRWLNDDEGAFVQIYAARRASVWAAYEANIAMLVPEALGAVQDLMRSETHHSEAAFNARVRLSAAETVLTMAGLLRKGARVFAPGGQVNIGEKQVNIGENTHAS
jgi:hypothetical protein